MRGSGPSLVVLTAALLLASPAKGPAAEEGAAPSPAVVPGTPGVADHRVQIDLLERARPEAQAPAPAREPVAHHPPLPIPEALPLPEGFAPPSLTETPEAGAPPARPELPAPDSPAPSASFLALDDGLFAIPPDTHGAAGPTHLMVTLNTEVRVQDRVGTDLGTVTLDGFWASVAGGSGTFDPKVTYDPYGGRWIFTACDDPPPFATTSALLIGVSQTSNPLGAWNLYRVDADPANLVWADYPSLGFNKDWIVVQVNMFNVSNNFFNRSHIYAFDKANLYAGGAGLFTLFQDATISGTQVPALTYDNALSTLYLVQSWNSGLGALAIHTITGPVGSEVLTKTVAFPTSPASWTFSPGNVDFAPQSGSSRLIRNNDARIQNLVYRNGTLWTTHTIFLPTGAPTRASVQWWEFNPSGTLLQRSRIDDGTGNLFFAFPTIAVNSRNDALVGYSRFSAAQFASGNYSFRSAIDPASTLQADTVLKPGEGPYEKDFTPGLGPNRWGDYSATTVDPVNDVDFWTIQEYAATPAGAPPDTGRWGTWWGRIDPPTPALSIGDAVVTEGDAGTVTATFTVSLSFATSATVTVDFATADGTATTTDLDYVASSGSLSFAPGQVAKTIDVMVNGDVKFEPNETFVVDLSNPANATILDGQGMGSINDDDPMPAISIDDVPVVEGNAGPTSAVFNVTLSNPSSQTIQVNHATQDGTATAPADYAPNAGTLTFAPGVLVQVLSVTVNGDTVLEGNETFHVDLSGPVNASVADGRGTATIVDDEAPAGDEAEFFSATSRGGENHLEWVNPNPAAPSFVSTEIVFRTDRFPTGPGDGTTIFNAGSAGTKSFITHMPLANGTTYFYGAFVHLSGPPFVSVGRFVTGRPFDDTGLIKWAHSVGATSMAPTGVGPAAVHAVANDNILHAMEKGAGGGRWPAGWGPRFFNGPSQGRPSTVPITVGTASQVVFLGSQDGNAHAVDADTGAPAWTTVPPLGAMVQAAPAGIFTLFGGFDDLILVGTRNSMSDNAFYALRAATGAVVAGWPFMGGGSGRIGIINGQATVDYAAQRAYFTNYERGPAPDNNTVWCVNLATATSSWAKPYGNIAASPTLRLGRPSGDRLYVGTNGGDLLALDPATGNVVWSFSTGDGALKSFVMTDRGTDDLYFSTTTRVWKLEDTGSPVLRWVRPAAAPSIPAPSTPVFYRSGAGAFLYVGSGDGRLYRLNPADGSDTLGFPLTVGDGSAGVGSPTIDANSNFLYVGTEAGIIHAIQLP